MLQTPKNDLFASTGPNDELLTSPEDKFSSFPVAHLPRAFPLPFLVNKASIHFPTRLLLTVMSADNAGFPRGNYCFRSSVMRLVPRSIGRPRELVKISFSVTMQLCDHFMVDSPAPPRSWKVSARPRTHQMRQGSHLTVEALVKI